MNVEISHKSAHVYMSKVLAFFFKLLKFDTTAGYSYH